MNVGYLPLALLCMHPDSVLSTLWHYVKYVLTYLLGREDIQQRHGELHDV